MDSFLPLVAILAIAFLIYILYNEIKQKYRTKQTIGKPPSVQRGTTNNSMNVNLSDKEIGELKNMSFEQKFAWIMQQSKQQNVLPLGFDHTQASNFDNVGKCLIEEHVKLRLRNTGPEQLVRIIEVFLCREVRLKLFELTNQADFHQTIPTLKLAARTLVKLEFPIVREWAVDLLGMVASPEDINILIDLANSDPESQVRKEATAAITKYLRFRNDQNGNVRNMVDTRINREEQHDNVLAARELLYAQLQVSNS